MLPLILVIIGATLIDGSGRAPIKDSVVVIENDRIVAAGRRGRVKIPQEARVIDARGMVVAPGFIDAHNHSDRGFQTDPSAASQVSQGITTIVVGQENPSVVIVPAGVVHGYQNIGDTEGIVINCPNRLYRGAGRREEVDEIRHENDGLTIFRM